MLESHKSDRTTAYDAHTGSTILFCRRRLTDSGKSHANHNVKQHNNAIHKLLLVLRLLKASPVLTRAACFLLPDDPMPCARLRFDVYDELKREIIEVLEPVKRCKIWRCSEV